MSNKKPAKIRNKILKAINNPRIFFGLFKRKFSDKFIHRLNPIKVTHREAENFFSTVAQENNHLVRMVQPYLESASVVFDVGANSGFFSKEILKAGFSGKIILFEPIPNLLSIAVNTLSKHNVEKIFVNSALGEIAGELELFLPNDSNIGWITAVKETVNQKSIRVLISSTKEYAIKFKPDFVKIDIEGFEAFVLRPFVELVDATFRPTFLVELGWGISNPHWGIFMDVARAFDKKGYTFYSVNSEKTKLSIENLAEMTHTQDVLICP